MNQCFLPDHSSVHWTNSMVLSEDEQDPKHPEYSTSIIFLFSGMILARKGEWWVTCGVGVCSP